MPGYLRPLPKPPTCVACGKKATHEVFNTYNSRIGYYCHACAQARVSEYNRQLAKEVRQAQKERYGSEI